MIVTIFSERLTLGTHTRQHTHTGTLKSYGTQAKIRTNSAAKTVLMLSFLQLKRKVNYNKQNER